MSKLQDYLAHKPELTGETYLWKQSAAAALEVSEKTLERAAKTGKIKAVEKNRKIMYLIEDLATFETDYAAEYQKPVIEPDNGRPTQTDTAIMMQNQNALQTTPGASFTPDAADLQQKYLAFMTERTEFEAKRAYFQCNVTFVLTEVAEKFNLSIVHLRDTAKTFRGKNQKLMITKKNLESYLERL